MKKYVQLEFNFLPWEDEEIWRDVIDGKYELSKNGILINKKSRKVRKGHLTKGGYILDSFNIDGKIITKLRHRLVFEAFIGEIPEGMQINHINEDKTDNRLENLNLMTCKENINWGTGIDRRAKTQTNSLKISKSVIQKTLEGKVIAIWPSIKEIERQLGYDNTLIGKCCKGKYFDKRYNKWYDVNTAYGYIWQYTEKAVS